MFGFVLLMATQNRSTQKKKIKFEDKIATENIDDRKSLKN